MNQDLKRHWRDASCDPVNKLIIKTKPFENGLDKPPIDSDGIAENYFVSGSSIGIVHAQGTKLNQEIAQGDYEMLLTRKL